MVRVYSVETVLLKCLINFVNLCKISVTIGKLKKFSNIYAKLNSKLCANDLKIEDLILFGNRYLKNNKYIKSLPIKYNII